jgi:hypothetical protein
MLEPEQRIVSNEHSRHDRQEQHPHGLDEGPANPKLHQDIEEPENTSKEAHIQQHSIGITEREAIEISLKGQQAVAEQHQRGEHQPGGEEGEQRGRIHSVVGQLEQDLSFGFVVEL